MEDCVNHDNIVYNRMFFDRVLRLLDLFPPALHFFPDTLNLGVYAWVFRFSFTACFVLMLLLLFCVDRAISCSSDSG